MFKLPSTGKEWLIAIASALAGFFFGGAAIGLVQKWLSEILGPGR